jgi:ABC-2 type transport system ATP-binding protein
MIETKDLIKQYDGVTVLNLPRLRIERGESFGLVGNNGAGKTTFFSLILDIIEANQGQVLSNEVDARQSEHWKSYTGSYLDERFLIDFLTPEEYFDFIRNINGLSFAEFQAFLDRFRDFFNGEVLDKNKYIRALSRGNQKKVGIAAALMSNPEVIVLDEPFPNLDPTTVIRLKNILKELQQSKQVTMLISSHDLNHVTEVCQRIAILEKGIIVHDLSTDENTLEQLQAYFDPIKE